MDKPDFEYNAEKNLKLIIERGIGFEDIIAILDANGPIALINHPNRKKYPHQHMYIVEIDGYSWVVPFERQGKKAILKTIYPSRKMTKLFRDKFSGGNKK